MTLPTLEDLHALLDKVEQTVPMGEVDFEEIDFSDQESDFIALERQLRECSSQDLFDSIEEKENGKTKKNNKKSESKNVLVLYFKNKLSELKLRRSPPSPNREKERIVSLNR